MANREKKILLILIQLISLPGIISILSISPPVSAIPGRITKIAQQPQTTSIKIAADKAYTEAEKLYQQGTAETSKLFVLSDFILWSKSANASSHDLSKTTKQQSTDISQIDVKPSLDVNREAAERAFKEARKFRSQETAKSLEQAIEKFKEAGKFWQAAGDRTGEATALTFVAIVNNSLGERQAALNYYNQALNLWRLEKNLYWQASTLDGIGGVYNSLGEKQKAFDYYNQALKIWQATKNLSGQATTLTGIGKTYLELGEKQKALDYLNQALPLTRTVKDRFKEASALYNMGQVYNSLGENQKALDYYNQALPLWQVLKNRAGEAYTLNGIGQVHFELGKQQKALDYYNQALVLRRQVGDRYGEAYTLIGIGRVYSELGDLQKTLEYYNQALSLEQAVGDKSGEAATLYNIARIHYQQGNFTTSLGQIKAALKIVESLRTKITSTELRTSYFATVQDYYKFYIDLLMELHKQQPSKGYNTQALQASESARARSLLELITESNADIRTGVDAKLLEAERNIQQQLDAQEKRRVQLLSGTYTPEQKQNLEIETVKLLDQYQDITTQIRSNSPRYAALTQPRPLTLQQIQQQVLDENTLLLEYSLGEEKSYLWAVSKTGMTSYELPKNTEIEKLVKNFRNEIVKPSSNKKTVFTASAPLTKILLAPVTEKLGNKRLIIVGDGALQYLPFAALSIPNSQEYQPLIINHEIVTLPSASTFALLRTEQKGRKPASKSIAMLADPVFTKDDQRITEKEKPIKLNTETLETLALKRASSNTDIKFKRLYFTRKEAETILQLVPTNQSLQAYDFTANRNFVINPQLSQYRILHFATHGVLDSKQPELSGLVLSLFNEKGEPENGFLRLHDVFNLNLSADLVVLSACQTGLGEEIKGEGVVGLTTGFMYAGSPRVVMSLWNVDDEGTSILMGKFYQKMLKDNLKPAAALRQAQIEMFKDEKFSKPDYWAAFTLQGEW